MKTYQKKSSLGKGISLGCGTIFIIIIIFFLFLIRVPNASKKNDTEMVRAFVTDTFHLKKNDVNLSFSTFIKSEAGHYNVTLKFSPDYKKNAFLNDNIKKDKQTFYSPNSPKMRSGYQFGRDYNEDRQVIVSLEDWMDVFGFDDERMNITYFAGKDIRQDLLKEPENIKETYFRLLVTSPKGWGNYLKDYYPPGKIEAPVLAKFEAGKGYFLKIHFSVAEIADRVELPLEPNQDELINQIQKTFSMKNVPNGTYFEVEYLGQILHLWYQDNHFSEIYSYN
ncbi:hypothetical protein [Vagococcus silagei]|uniref:Uncharacterized protein n=1 Tax=Vagococcus silagei TaxID=2508885 RepID=A0A4S3B4W4_9ENTE|nr:hypothetical protein [Vagococcus silagei]THB62121.1 hypothetical protein ESZ54_02630 [Vagococcus silagei]